MNEGLGMDPNPSSFLPLIFVLHNSTNLSSTICFTIRLSKLAPTSDIAIVYLSCILLYLILSTTVDQTVNTVLVQLGTIRARTRPLTCPPSVIKTSTLL